LANQFPQPNRATVEGGEEVLMLGSQSCQDWTQAASSSCTEVQIAFGAKSQLIGVMSLAEQFGIGRCDQRI